MKVKYLAVITALAIACNQPDQQRQASQDSTQAMKESMDDLDQSSVKFVTEVGEYNQRMIALGQIAERNGGYDRVRNYGTQMTDAYTKANSLLQQSAYSSGTTVPPAADDTSMLSDLADKKGAAFDKAYADKMVNTNQHIYELLDVGSKKLDNTELKKYADSVLPLVKQHLDDARNLLEDVRKNYRPEQGPDRDIK